MTSGKLETIVMQSQVLGVSKGGVKSDKKEEEKVGVESEHNNNSSSSSKRNEGDLYYMYSLGGGH
jgi:hypothetical protein